MQHALALHSDQGGGLGEKACALESVPSGRCCSGFPRAAVHAVMVLAAKPQLALPRHPHRGGGLGRCGPLNRWRSPPAPASARLGQIDFAEQQTTAVALATAQRAQRGLFGLVVITVKATHQAFARAGGAQNTPSTFIATPACGRPAVSTATVCSFSLRSTDTQSSAKMPGSTAAGHGYGCCAGFGFRRSGSAKLASSSSSRGRCKVPTWASCTCPWPWASKRVGSFGQQALGRRVLRCALRTAGRARSCNSTSAEKTPLLPQQGIDLHLLAFGRAAIEVMQSSPPPASLLAAPAALWARAAHCPPAPAGETPPHRNCPVCSANRPVASPSTSFDPVRAQLGSWGHGKAVHRITGRAVLFTHSIGTS